MAAAHDIQALLAQLGSRGKLRLAQDADTKAPAPNALALGWPELDAVLPDGGVPRGVVELAAPRAVGGSTSVALAAVRAGQARSTSAWCAWLDPEATLHAPGVVAAGVDLSRMLVVRVPRAELARVAVKMVSSGAFEVVVIDVDAIPGAATGQVPHLVKRERIEKAHASHTRSPRRGWAPEVVVRKLALAAEPNGTTVLLLTDASRARAVPWPVAMRIDLSRPNARDLHVRVAKDKRGRVGPVRAIPFRAILGVAS
ncbi:MAG: recombinase A [Myxococcales bacterium]|nr:recombinase A [Myxococcales bacterium]